MKTEATALDAPSVRLRVGEVLRNAQKRSVTFTGTPAKMESSIALSPSPGAGDLDGQVGAPAEGVEPPCLARGRLRVVCEDRRDLERDVAVDAACPVEDGAEDVGGVPEIVQGELEEGLFGARPAGRGRANRLLVRGRPPDRAVVDGRVGGQARDGQLAGVALERSARQQVPGDDYRATGSGLSDEGVRCGFIVAPNLNRAFRARRIACQALRADVK
jgi:hypothetical protein